MMTMNEIVAKQLHITCHVVDTSANVAKLVTCNVVPTNVIVTKLGIYCVLCSGYVCKCQ